jgi:hypothetical protein
MLKAREEYRAELDLAKQIGKRFKLTRVAMYYIRVGQVATSAAAKAYARAIRDGELRSLGELKARYPMPKSAKQFNPSRVNGRGAK